MATWGIVTHSSCTPHSALASFCCNEVIAGLAHITMLPHPPLSFASFNRTKGRFIIDTSIIYRPSSPPSPCPKPSQRWRRPLGCSRRARWTCRRCVIDSFLRTLLNWGGGEWRSWLDFVHSTGVGWIEKFESTCSVALMRLERRAVKLSLCIIRPPDHDTYTHSPCTSASTRRPPRGPGTATSRY